jgi:hypothetical protein
MIEGNDYGYEPSKTDFTIRVTSITYGVIIYSLGDYLWIILQNSCFLTTFASYASESAPMSGYRSLHSVSLICCHPILWSSRICLSLRSSPRAVRVGTEAFSPLHRL